MWKLLSAMWFGFFLCGVQNSMNEMPHMTKPTTILEAFFIMAFLVFVWYCGYSSHKETLKDQC